MKKFLILILTIPLLAAGKLPLKNVVFQAMKSNPDIMVYKYSPIQAKSMFEASKSIFIPQFQLNASASRDQNKPTSIFEGRGEEVKSNRQSGNLSLVQNLPTGGQINFGITQNRNYTTNTFYQLNPSYTSIFQLTISHPLLKNMGVSVTKQNIIISRKNYEKSLFDFRAQASNTIFSVIQTYWNYLYYLESYGVKQDSLKLAQDLYQQNKEMVKIGTKAPLDLIEAEAEVENRRAELIDARNQLENAREQLMLQTGIQNIPEDPSMLEVPKLTREEIELQKMIELALRENPQVLAAKKELESAEFQMKVKKNALKPKLNLQLVMETIGRAGTKNLYLDNNPFSGVIIGKIEGNVADSINEALKGAYNSIQLQLVYTMPVKRQKEVNEFQAAVANYYRAKKNYEKVRAEIESQVRSAWRDAMAAYQRIKATQKARKLAEEKLRAEQEKFAHGSSTNYMVLTYQRDLANARINELRAIMDYNIALFKLKQATGTLLSYFGVSIKADEDFGGYSLIK